MPAPTLQNVSRPRALGFGLALGDRLFRLAVGPGRELSIQTAPLSAPRIDTTSSPEEAASADELSLTFARSQFSGGQGLFRAHLEESAADRFWDSKNVSVRPAEPGEFPSVRLLPATENLGEPGGTTPRSRLAYDGSSLYVAGDGVFRRTDDPTAASPTFVNDDPFAGEAPDKVYDVAVLGDEVYAALGTNGIHRKPAGGVWSHWSDTVATRIWAVKGRIVAAGTDDLYEVTSSGVAPSPLMTLASGKFWRDVCDGGSHILAAADDGYVYAFTTDSGSMALSGQTLFEGEEPYALGQTQGVVAIGTQAAKTGMLWVGELAENGQLANLQLVKQWGRLTQGGSNRTPRRILATRDSLLTCVPEFSASSASYVWRYDVSTAGISRHLTVDEAGSAVGLEMIQGRLFVGLLFETLHRQATGYASSGYLIGPLGDFYSSANKSWVGARLETGDLTDGMAVELYFATDPDAMSDPDSELWTRVVRRDSGSGDPGEELLPDTSSRSLVGMVKLEPSADGLSTPAVRSFSFRAYPSAGAGDAEQIVTIPVNVSDQIERPGRGRVRVKGRGATEYATLRGMQGEPVVMRLYNPDLTLRGIVEQVAAPVQALTYRGSPTLVAQVRVRGRTGGAGVTSGIGPWGTDRVWGSSIAWGKDN